MVQNSAFGIDLGTSNIKIYSLADDTVTIEKNMIAIENKKNIFAYGNSAYEMYEKAPANIQISHPLANGVIADINNMERLVKFFITDISKGNLKPSDFYIAVPTDITEVEKRAFYDLIKEAGVKAKKIMVVEKAVADGLGMDIDVKNSQGVLVVDIGYDTTEVSILSLGGIVLSRLIKTGGLKFDEAIRQAGTGSLYEAFVRLKAKLETEGLFDQIRKRPIPLLPRAIGIITSPKAAALRDILTTLDRRAPHLPVILYPTQVQGAEAPAAIVQAVETACARAECDVLLICRGGGSMEDLWSFNDEQVARAIANCTIPTISGIGHETDFTIADFVSDLRAPTPTGAAELAARARTDWMNGLATQADKLRYAMKRHLEKAMQETDALSARLISPSAYISRERLKCQTLATRLSHTGASTLATWRHELDNMRTRLKAQLPDTASHRTLLAHRRNLLERMMVAQLADHRKNVLSLSAQLELLNPQRTLERGYAIMTDTEGQIIRSPGQLPIHKPVSVRLADGTAQIRIESVQNTIE